MEERSDIRVINKICSLLIHENYTCNYICTYKINWKANNTFDFFFLWLMHLENWFETNVFYMFASLRLLICLDYSCIHIVLSMKCYFNEMVIHFSMNNTKKQIVEIHSQFNPVNTTRNKPINTRNATHRYRKKIQKNYPNLVSKPWSKPWSKLMKRHHLIVQAKERKKRIRDPKQEEASKPHLLFPPPSRGGGKMANNGIRIF